MVFSPESSQAIFEMGNVELIELKTSMIQCPSCLHNVFKGTLLCRCGMHIRPDPDTMLLLSSRRRHAFARRGLMQGDTNMALTYGRNTTTKQKTHFVVVRKAKDSIRRTGTDGKETKPSGSPSWSMSGQMLGEILGPYCKNRHLPYSARTHTEKDTLLAECQRR